MPKVDSLELLSGCRLAACIALVTSFLTAQVAASSLQVSPVKLNFKNDENAHAIYLSNNGNVPIRAQVTPVQWLQKENKDVLIETNELIVSPPIIELPAGKRQLVRIITPHSLVSDSEVDYRLIIDELPGPAVDEYHVRNVNFLLRYSIPVFIQPHNDSGSNEILVSLRNQHLVVENRGAKHIKLSDVYLTSLKGRTIPLAHGLLGYVLPGQVMSWPINTTADVKELNVHFNDETNAHAIALQSSPVSTRINTINLN